jgi:recombinational DNA repair protein (RecF pathway)
LHVIDEKTATPVERAIAFLKLFAAGTFTEGRLAEKARALVLTQLAQPGFFTAYVSQLAQSNGQSDADSAMSSLMQMLEKAGIAPETGLKSLAA